MVKFSNSTGPRTESTSQAHGQLLVPSTNSAAVNFAPEEESVESPPNSDSNSGATFFSTFTVTDPDLDPGVEPDYVLVPEPGLPPADLTTAQIIAQAAAGSEGSGQTNDFGFSGGQTFETEEDRSFGAKNKPTTGNIMVIGSTIKTRDQIKKAVDESTKIDLQITLRSRKSEVVEFNCLKVPEPELKFHYNFFSDSEESVESQEDQSKDPLLNSRPIDVPRYVELTWDATSVTNQIPHALATTKLNRSLRAAAFFAPRGVAGYNSDNFASAVSKQSKNMPSYVVDGVQKVVTDIHNPELGFNGIANNGTFANTVSVVVNSSAQPDTIVDIPFTSVSLK